MGLALIHRKGFAGGGVAAQEEKERLAFGVVHEVAMIEGVGDGPVKRGP